jgi:hypothetical protein
MVFGMVARGGRVFGMPRQLRVECPGAIYHALNRANGKGKILETDVDRQDFVKTLAKACAKTGFENHACCLTGNPWSHCLTPLQTARNQRCA